MWKSNAEITQERRQELDGLYQKVFRDTSAELIPAGKDTQEFWDIVQIAIQKLSVIDIDPIFIGTAPGLWDGMCGCDWVALTLGNWSAQERRFDWTEGPEYDENGEPVSFDISLLDGLKYAYLKNKQPERGYTAEQQSRILRDWNDSSAWPKEMTEVFVVHEYLESADWRHMWTEAFGPDAFLGEKRQWYMEDSLILAIQDSTPWLLFRDCAYSLWNDIRPMEYFGMIGSSSKLSLWDFGVVKYHYQKELSVFDFIDSRSEEFRRPHFTLFTEDPRVIRNGKEVGVRNNVRQIRP